MTTLPERMQDVIVEFRRIAKDHEIRADRPHQDDATCQWHMGTSEAYDDAADRLEAVQALQAAPEGGEWVSVKDRLPERWEHVEVYPDPNDKRTYNYFAVADGGTNGVKANRWYHNDSDGYDNEITVTHWRKKAAAPSPTAALQAGEA